MAPNPPEDDVKKSKKTANPEGQGIRTGDDGAKTGAEVAVTSYVPSASIVNSAGPDTDIIKSAESAIKSQADDDNWKVKKLHGNKKNPVENDCRDSQEVSAVAQINCRSIEEKENAPEGTIVDVIRPIPDKVTLNPGDRFDNKEQYILGEKLGDGGNSVVWSAELLQHGLAPSVRLAAKLTNVTKSERKAIKELRDAPNVARHFFVVELRHPWLSERTNELKKFKHLLFMERAEFSLKDHISDSLLSVEDAAIYFLQLAKAVTYFHSRSYNHNDINVSNVLMYRVGNLLVAHLSDLQFAKAHEVDEGPANDILALGIFYLRLTVGFRIWPRGVTLQQIHMKMVNQLKKKHKKIGKLIETCLYQEEYRPTIQVLLEILNKIGVEEKWWRVCSNMLGL